MLRNFGKLQLKQTGAGPLLRGSAIARPKNISSIRSGIVAKVTGPAEQPFRGGVTEAASYIIP